MAPTRRSTTRATSCTSATAKAYPPTRSANTRLSLAAPTRPSASVDRSAVNGSKPGLRLTVKAPPSKLRQATSSSQQAAIPPNPYADTAASESDATPQPAGRAARSTRNPKTVVEPDSDDVEDDAEGDEDEDEDMEDAVGDVDQELLANEDSEEDAEGDDDDEIEDEDQHPPPPIIRQHPPGKSTSKPNVTVTAPPSDGPLKSVEAKEMEDEEDDELSELDDNDDVENIDNDDEDDLNTGSDEDLDGSRSATPDLSKLTRRQRGLYEEADAGLMALSNEAQKKKHLTAEEHAMRRQEMARRRKNLSEKRNEEEKMDTINKLLKKPAPKRRTRAEIIAQQHADALAGTPGAEDGEEERPDPLFTRWVSSASGSRLGVPEEWMEVPELGEMFRGNESVGRIAGSGLGSGRLVEEVA